MTRKKPIKSKPVKEKTELMKGFEQKVQALDEGLNLVNDYLRVVRELSFALSDRLDKLGFNDKIEKLPFFAAMEDNTPAKALKATYITIEG